jgi:hypothetical protein
MHITQFYGIAASSLLIILLISNILRHTAKVRRNITLCCYKHLTYPYLLDRHLLIGPWTRASIIIQLTYLSANVVCICLQSSTFTEAGLHSASLALINLIPLLAGPHLGFLADAFGFSLESYRSIHRSAGWMFIVLVVFHISMALIHQSTFSIIRTSGWSGVVVMLYHLYSMF